MKFTLKNYCGEKIEIEVPRYDNAVAICLRVSYGDQILEVLYDDGTVETFDSDRHDRLMDNIDWFSLYLPSQFSQAVIDEVGN